uniref:DUF2318 domain-containing protein n=1 Tax=Geobacter metallireducens TaxID=28232 RepID=A0A831U6Z0_GEOME
MGGKAAKSIVKNWAMALVVVLAVAGTVAAFSLPGFGKAEKVKASGGVVSIPLSKVSDGKAHFYKFTDGGKEISFFVVKAPDGTLKTAFDACDVCFREKKGYTQDGAFMVCRQCNMKFSTNRIGPHAVGGCNPSYLPGRQAGGSVIINVADLKAGSRYF